MKPRLACVPEQSVLQPSLHNASFFDAYEVENPQAERSALAIWLDTVQKTPRWVNQSMALRNAVVARLGLKHAGDLSSFDFSKRAQDYQVGDRVGIFTVYAISENEVIMGEIFKRAGWRRASYVVSTKFFWGLHAGPNERNTLNRKYLMQAIDGSLQRLGMEYVDLVFCHRPDPNTPIEETVFAMHDIIRQGKALYWGTSEWSADEIRAAAQVETGVPLLRVPILMQEALDEDRLAELEIKVSFFAPVRPGLVVAEGWIERRGRKTCFLEGHPDLRRILMPEEFRSFPLRKDYPLRGRGERHNFSRLTREES